MYSTIRLYYNAEATTEVMHCCMTCSDMTAKKLRKDGSCLSYGSSPKLASDSEELYKKPISIANYRPGFEPGLFLPLITQITVPIRFVTTQILSVTE
jgi:hypothetical protein